MSASATHKTLRASGYVHKLRLEALEGGGAAITAVLPPSRRPRRWTLVKLIGLSFATASLLACLVLLAGCGGVSDLKKERVARSETSVQQAQQAIGHITTYGKAESTPVASNDDVGGRQQNRRVELIFQEGPRVASDSD